MFFPAVLRLCLAKNRLKMAISKESDAHTHSENMLQMSWGTFFFLSIWNIPLEIIFETACYFGNVKQAMGAV